MLGARSASQALTALRSSAPLSRPTQISCRARSLTIAGAFRHASLTVVSRASTMILRIAGLFGQALERLALQSRAPRDSCSRETSARRAIGAQDLGAEEL